MGTFDTAFLLLRLFTNAFLQQFDIFEIISICYFLSVLFRGSINVVYQQFFFEIHLKTAHQLRLPWLQTVLPRHIQVCHNYSPDLISFDWTIFNKLGCSVLTHPFYCYVQSNLTLLQPQNSDNLPTTIPILGTKFRYFKIIYLWTTTTCLQQPQFWGPKGGGCTYRFDCTYSQNGYRRNSKIFLEQFLFEAPLEPGW